MAKLERFEFKPLQSSYTLSGPNGTVTLKTDQHHSIFDSIEDFLKHHEKTIQALYYGATVALSALTVHHAGKKLQ
jgi:hypothetical protein